MTALFIALALLATAGGETAVTGTPTSAPARITPDAGARKFDSIITSDRLDVDRGNNTAIFEGNVHVKDPKGEIWADRMEVFYGDNGRKVDKIVCMGKNVIILSRRRKSRSDKAIYTAIDGKIVLTGDPRIDHGKHVYRADKIIMFKDTDKVIFEPKARLILHPEGESEGFDGLL